MTTSVDATTIGVKYYSSDYLGRRCDHPAVRDRAEDPEKYRDRAEQLIDRLERAAARVAPRKYKGKQVGSFRKLATEAKLSHSTANKLLARLRASPPGWPEVGTIYALADAAGVRRDWLLCGAGEMTEGGEVSLLSADGVPDAPPMPAPPSPAKKSRNRRTR